MPPAKGFGWKMAKKTAAKRNAELAALIVALADGFSKFLTASGVDLPELQGTLANIQQLAYTTVAKEETSDFGLTFAATQGIVMPAEANGQAAASEPVAVLE